MESFAKKKDNITFTVDYGTVTRSKEGELYA